MTKEEEDNGDDPFSCFDDSSDDEDDDNNSDNDNDDSCNEHTNNHEQIPNSKRDPENGVLSFHAGTEVALLHHVKMKLEGYETKTSQDGVMQTIEKSNKLLEIIDSYCLNRHWMMHIGPEKGNLIRTFIVDCLQKKKENCDNNGNDNTIVNFVELGTYCGYSSIFIAKTILEHYNNNNNNNNNNDGDQATTATIYDGSFSFQIYSVEVVERFAKVAKEMIRLAGMDQYVTVITIDPEQSESSSSLSSELRTTAAATMSGEDSRSMIDFLFVDHDKSRYLSDLKELEVTGMIKKGTYIAADNVIFAEIQDYRQYMSKLSDEGIVTTRLEDSLVEFCQPELLSTTDGSTGDENINSNNDDDPSTTTPITKDMLRDGIEFSVYTRDPI
jgi:catechol O-methyltransferase